MIYNVRLCSKITLVAVILVALLVINLVAYYILESSSGLSYKIPEATSSQAVKTTNIKEKSEPVRLVLIQRQKYVPAQDHSETASAKAKVKILATLSDIKERYVQHNPARPQRLQPSGPLSKTKSVISLNITEEWLSGTEVIPAHAPELSTALATLCSLKILKADNTKKGTQLKILFHLEGGYRALFKPQWYERNTVINGPVYAGKDRHNAEVAAFYLSLLLGMRRVPLTVGRKVNLRREVMEVATPALRQTFYQEGNNTCFYGVCHYCSPADPVCARQDIIEGALILWLPQKLTFARYTHPWQRSYRNHLLSRWEIETDYCDRVKSTKAYASNENHRLLDLIDTAIFDFLIGNGDRHHYEAPINIKPSAIFLFDNGKSFGNPDVDHIDILAPLYQCCILRKNTWQSLFEFRGGVLGKDLEKLLSASHIAPVLTESHLKSLDRRLLVVFAAVETCMRENPGRPVLR